MVADLCDGMNKRCTPVPMAVTPSRVDVGTSAAITITGENFLLGATAWLGDVPLLDAHRMSPTMLTATVPITLPPGVYDVWVTNSGGQASALPGGLAVGKMDEISEDLRSQHRGQTY